MPDSGLVGVVYYGRSGITAPALDPGAIIQGDYSGRQNSAEVIGD